MLIRSRKKHFTHNAVIGLLVAFSAFTFSIWIDPYYTDGDPLLYRQAYEYLAGKSLIDAYSYYSSILDSKEFVHFFISWLASNLHIERSIFNAASSAILAYVSMSVFLRLKASTFISAFIVLTSIYFILMFSTTERLKIGMIFFCLSILNSNNQKKCYFFALLASITHIQIMLLYLPIIFYRFSKGFYRHLLTGKISNRLFLSFILFSIPLILVSDQISSKLSSYYAIRDITDLSKMFVFLALSFWYSRRKAETVHVFIPLLIAVFFLGGERLNFFGYFCFLYYALPVNKGVNVGIFCTTAYFSYASILFISSILEHGSPSFF